MMVGAHACFVTKVDVRCGFFGQLFDPEELHLEPVLEFLYAECPFYIARLNNTVTIMG
jgi:hypothetical protein